MATVLVTDDEYTVRYALRTVLKRAGHIVLEACDGAEALNVLKNHAVDVVILDMIMPNKEGVETTIEIQQTYPSVKIVAISGGGRTRNLDFLAMAQTYGAQTVLSKPFTNEQLLESIST